MSAYTKLFSSILDSSVWMESDQTRLVWITLLAMSDQFGEVQASVPGLARRAGVSLDAATDAIDRLSSPDPHSRTPDHEGRRIAKIDGGWEILNHAKYRRMASLDERKEKAAIRQARFRERHCESGQEVTQNNAGVTLGNDEVTPSNTPSPDSNASVTHLPDKQKQKQKQKQREEQPSVVAEAPKPDSKPARKPRPRNALLDALMEGCQYTNPTRSQFACGATALSEIKEVDPDVTPERILEFCRTKRRDWNGEEFTPMAMAKHWRTPLEDEGQRVARIAALPARDYHRPGIDD